MFRRFHVHAAKSTRSGGFDEPQRLLIVGDGMVAHRLCQRLVPEPNADTRAPQFLVTVLGEEPYPAYDRIRLSESPSPDIDNLLLGSPGWYAARGIALHTRSRVTRLELAESRVVLESGETLSYDKLVLATGSEPFLPPIQGLSACEHVQVFRTYDDLGRLRAQCQPGRVAAIIGGGLLGLETAKVLVEAGARAHVLEASSYLMPRQLDADSARLLNDRIRDLGVETHLGIRTRAVETEADAATLVFEGDEPPLRADLIVVAAGTTPRDELAREAGLSVGGRGGVIIDEHLRTSAENVFAVGECVSFKGERIGLVSPGYDMADVLADNLRGGRARFTTVDQSCHLKLMGVPVAASGLYDRDVTALGVDVPGGRRTLMLDGTRLIGMTSVGSWPSQARVQDACLRQTRLSHRQLQRFRREGELWAGGASDTVQAWPESTVVCNCVGVTRGQLSACMAQGCRDVSALGAATGAGTTCGSCVGLLAQLCDAPSVRAPSAGGRTLMASSIVALLLASLFVVLKPVPFAESVQLALREVDRFFRDDLLKQTTGFAILGVTVLGSVFSLRKRTRLLSRGSFGSYRGFHALAGALALVVVVAHTGMRFGENLNLMLMGVFTAACAVGALTGVASALESTPGSALALQARKLRRPLTWAHLLLFWPLPILVGLHIFSVYYF